MKLLLKVYAPIAIASLLLAGCKDNVAGTTETTGAPTPADNTQVNQRDRSPTITPMDQGNSQADLSTTQQIRKAVMADDALSSDAKNVKIMTSNGVVTLRGPVKSEAERSSIEAKANQFAGSNRVDDRLDIEAPR
jgi:hyperosmotically inducible periplasmic protein